MLPIGRRKGVGIGEHRLHRLLCRRIPLRRLIAKERLDAVRPDKGKQTSARIRVLRIHHLGILAVKRIRRKADTDAEDAGCRRHGFLEHLDDRIAAACLRWCLQNVLNANLGNRSCLIRLVIAQLHCSRDASEFLKALRLRTLFERSEGHVADNPQDDRHDDHNADSYDTVDLESDAPPFGDAS